MFTGIPNATRTAGVATLVVAAAIGLAGVARADGQMYGDPEAAAPYWRYQHQQDCGLMSVADVVGQLTGREPSQIGMELRGVFTKSESHRGDVYHFDGTSPQDMVLLLQKHGIESDLTTGNSMGTLEQDLAGGHKVIAALNAETIWNYPPGRWRPDHARPRRRRHRSRHRYQHHSRQRQWHPDWPRRADPDGHLQPSLDNQRRPADRHPGNRQLTIKAAAL